MQPSARTKDLWSQYRFRGLTPDAFWSSRSALLATPRSDLGSIIDGLAGSRNLRETGSVEHGWTASLKPVHSVRGRLLSGVVSELPNPPPPLLSTTSKGLAHRLAYVLIAPNFSNKLPVEEGGDLACQNILQMLLPTSVSAHSNYLLYDILPEAIPFIREHLTAGGDVCVACPTGKDLGPGAIVAALSLFFGDNGDLLSDDDIDNKGEPAGKDCVGSRLNASPGPAISKSTIQKRLQWVISSNPGVNPSRNTLKRVNEFLMSHLHHPHYASPSSTPQTSS